MKCPYCGEEMEDGLIQSPQEIFWYKKKRSFGISALYEDSIVLSKLALWKGSAIISYNCRKCEKLVIDYNGGYCDFNKKLN